MALESVMVGGVSEGLKTLGGTQTGTLWSPPKGMELTLLGSTDYKALYYLLFQPQSGKWIYLKQERENGILATTIDSKLPEELMSKAKEILGGRVTQ